MPAVDAPLSPSAAYAGARMVDMSCNWKTLLECALAGEGVAWHWPALLLRQRGEVTLIDQIVPRTFLRTRVIRHAYAAGANEAAVQSAMAELNALKTQVEALQTARASGAAADATHARVAELHAHLTRAYASDTSAA